MCRTRVRFVGRPAKYNTLTGNTWGVLTRVRTLRTTRLRPGECGNLPMAIMTKRTAALAVVVALASGMLYLRYREASIAAETAELLKPSEIAHQINPEIKGWQYTVEKDAMRGTSTKVARLQADDYNAYLTPTIAIWKNSAGRQGAQLESPMVVGAVNIHCDARTRVVTIRIDNGPVRDLRCTTGMSIGVDSSLVSMLQGSKKMVLEAATSLSGRKQYTFNTAGLEL